jgi:hypothetical protein
MAHLVDATPGRLIGDYLIEVKGGDEKLTLKGVTSLADKIKRTLTQSAFSPR